MARHGRSVQGFSH